MLSDEDSSHTVYHQSLLDRMCVVVGRSFEVRCCIACKFKYKIIHFNLTHLHWNQSKSKSTVDTYEYMFVCAHAPSFYERISMHMKRFQS